MELRSVTDLQQQASRSSDGTGALQQQDFMKLMTVQLKNQDPFKPMDNGEFLGQLAQFSTVSGIEQMQESLATLSESLQSTQLLNASSLIGKSALFNADSVRLSGDGSVNGALALDQAATDVTLEILSPAGEVLRRQELGNHGAGTVNFEWDGNDDRGRRLGEGPWLIRASHRVGDKGVELPVQLQGTIESVSIPSGGGSAELNVKGLGSTSLADVKSLS